MPPNLRDVTREFARGEASLEVVRAAAREERFHRYLADEILKLIAEWEDRGWDSTWSRNELRSRARQLVPDPPASSRREPTESFYDVGLRGQRRRS